MEMLIWDIWSHINVLYVMVWKKNRCWSEYEIREKKRYSYYIGDSNTELRNTEVKKTM